MGSVLFAVACMWRQLVSVRTTAFEKAVEGSGQAPVENVAVGDVASGGSVAQQPTSNSSAYSREQSTGFLLCCRPLLFILMNATISFSTMHFRRPTP